MARVAYSVTIRSHPGRREELLAVLRSLVDAARDEPGTEVYVMHTVDDDPDLVLTYELFRDEAALRAHAESDAVQRALPLLADLVAESTARRGVPTFGKGLVPDAPS